MAERPIDTWRKKLQFLQGEEAKASDASQKFTLQEQIDEAKAKIAELETANPSTEAPARKEPATKSGRKARPERKALKAAADPLVVDLCEMIDRRQVVVVVGSGVSVATNDNSFGWRALIQAGIAHCKNTGASERWCEMVSGQLELIEEPDMLLSAAELVHGKLGAGGGGELARWLRETFEPLEPEQPSVIQSLAALQLPLLTTNYDDLIEKATSLKHVTWQDTRHVSRVIRGDDRRVLHLHGHCSRQVSIALRRETVSLFIRSSNCAGRHRP